LPVSFGLMNVLPAFGRGKGIEMVAILLQSNA
jgi:hypothetical protein